MCDKLRVLTWENNSCYMDSVLFALFSTPNAFLEKMTVQQRFTRAMEGLCGDQSAGITRIQKSVPFVSSFPPNPFHV